MENILVYSIQQQGNAISISCSNGRELVADNWDDVSNFLLMPCKMALVYSVDKLAEIIASKLPKGIREKVLSGGRVYTEDNRKLFYQPARMFGINHIDFYPLKLYTNKEITDIKELSQLADKVFEAYKQLGITPTKLSSPVSAFSEKLDRVDFPRACDLPESALPMINKCAEKAWVEWREVFRLGHWNADDVMDIDLTSAYPYLMSKLPDIRGASFFESDVMPDNNDYSWGEIEGELAITKNVTPFLYVGAWPDSITTDLLWLINRYNLGEFKLKHGWFFKLPQYYRLPFKETVQNLYQTRQNENLVIKTISKAISVGIGGKLSQRYEDGGLGDYCNPIYSRMITTRCQVKVADMIWRYGLSKDVIAILVDGFLAENHGVKITLNDSGMGSWRVNEPSPFLVASLLYEWGGSKKPDGNYYQAVMDGIKKNPKSPIIGNGVDLNLLTFDRRFESLPKNGGDLLNRRYNSKPRECQAES